MNTQTKLHLTPDTLVQFDLIREIATLLGQARIPYWLRGGWALDFFVGHITRSHSDIDLVTWKQHASDLRRVLVSSEFAFSRDLGVQMDFTRHGQEISIVFVATDQMGRIFTPDIPDWIWLPEALSFPSCQLQDLSCRIVSPAQLLHEKETYEQGTGRPLRPKDAQSMAMLQHLIKHEDQF